MQRIEMIGSPVDHVRSPDLLNALFRAAGDDAEVLTTEVTAELLPSYVRAARERGMAGLIVTTPLKQAIVAHLDRTTDLARLVGAVNCIRIDGTSWLGANFDGFGFVDALRAVAGDFAGMRILLVGCGGAGAAIAASLLASAEVDLALFDLEAQKPIDLAARLALATPRSRVRLKDDLQGAFDIVINASTAGMRAGDHSPVPSATVAAARIVADIVALDATALKREAQRFGKPFLSGEAMVRAQAVLLREFLLGDAESEDAVYAAVPMREERSRK
jgi:shikimate dehydrogenase